MRAVLNDKLLRSIAVRGRAHADIRDQHLVGLVGRTGRHGRITFYVVARCRHGGRQPLRLRIGPYPAVSLAEARTRARRLLRDLADGIDPRQHRKVQQQAEIARRAELFGTIAETFIRRHLPGKDTARAIEARIRREMLPRWGRRAIGDITRGDIASMIDAIIERGHKEAARQTFVYARRLFRWAVTRGHIGHAPTDHFNITDLLGAKRPRQRVFAASELALLWPAAGALSYPIGPYVQLLMLLGTRRGELAGATWAEFDLDKALWLIPAERMKSDEAFAVPLPPRAVEILRSLPRGSCDYVFSRRGDRPLAGFSRMKRALDAQVARLQVEGTVPGFTLHDCRRTFRTGLSSLGIPTTVAELCLAHRQPGVRRVYDTHRFDREKRHAFEAWASYLLSIVEPVPEKVIPLHAASA